MLSGTKPDLTPAHLIAVVIAGIPIVANLLNVFGVYHATPEQQKALESTLQWGALFAGFLVGGDTVLRSARNHAAAKMTHAVLQAPGEPHEVQTVTDKTVQEAPLSEDEIASAIGDDEAAVPDSALPSDADELANLPQGV